MADALTPNYGFTLPEPGGSDSTWGDKLNGNWGSIDTLLKAMQDAAAPVGTILMYDATAALPANWAICDGQNGTPDLRDRFIIGSSASRPAKSTGGKFAITDVPAHTHAPGTLAVASGGAHGHTGQAASAGGHSHAYVQAQSYQFVSISGSVTRGYVNGGGVPDGQTRQTDQQGAHTHTLTIDTGGAHAHSLTGGVAEAGVASVDITPPYYAVVYIRRMT